MFAMGTLLILQLGAQETIVDRAEKAAELFWQQFTAVRSLEHVTQEKLKDDGTVVAKRSADFDYLALLATKGGSVAVEESRVPRTRVADKPEEFLKTSGFPALLLMFHPDYRDRFQFEESPNSDVPPGLMRVAFRSRPNLHALSAVKLNGRLFPILWKGFAWIERNTGAITRMESTLDVPMADIGVSELLATVEYEPVGLSKTSQTYRLPVRVSVIVRSQRQQWRDTHEFSGYQLFTVTTSTRGETPGSQP